MSGKSKQAPETTAKSEHRSDKPDTSKAPASGNSNAWMMQWLKDYSIDPKATKTTPGPTKASSTETSLSLLKDSNFAPKASQTTVNKNKSSSQQWTESSKGLGASSKGVALDLSKSNVSVQGKGRRDKPDGRTFTTSKDSTTGGGHFKGTDDWSLNLGRASSSDLRTERKGLDSTESSHSAAKSIAVGSNGVDFKAGNSSKSVSGAESKNNYSVGVGDHQVRAGAGMERTSASGNKMSGSLAGSVTYNKPTPREINAKSSGLDATIRDLAGGDTTATGRTSGASIAAEVGVGKGAFGVSASAHAATENGVHFHTSQSGIDKDNIEDRHASRLPDSPNMQSLDLGGLQSGEGYSLQHTGSVGAGLGAVIYGIGAGGSIQNSDVQQTVIHRNDEGYLVDIQTMDAETAAGNVNLGGGVVEVGGSVSEGSSSRVRFQTNEDSMMAFQQTGILPGAIESLGADDKRRELYARAVNDPESVSDRERVMLTVMARELNARIMGHDPSNQTLPEGGEGTEYLQAEQGQTQGHEGNFKIAGFTALDSGYQQNRSTMAYRAPGGRVLPQETLGDDSNYWFRADDHSNHRVGGQGNVLSSQSTTNLLTGQRENLYGQAGDRMATETQYGGHRGGCYSYQAPRGNKDRISVQISEEDRQRLAPNLDYEGGSGSWRADARKNQLRMGYLNEAMDADCSPEQILDYMRLGVLDANRPTMRDPRTMQVRDPSDPFSSFGRTASDPFTDYVQRVQEHDAEAHRARMASLGLQPSEIKDAQKYVDQLNPSWVDHARSGIAQDQQLDLHRQGQYLEKNQRMGAVESLDDLKILTPAEQTEWLRRATNRDMTMVLAIEDPALRTHMLTLFVDSSEMGEKGSQFSLEFAEELMGLVQEDSPEEFKELIQEVIKLERVQGK